MRLKVYIRAIDDRYADTCIKLPTNNREIDIAMKVTGNSYNEKCFITNYYNNLDLIIPNQYENIYLLNEMIYKINALANNKEINALSEVYSNNLFDLVKLLESNNYKIYKKKSLKDIADTLSEYEYYEIYNSGIDANSIMQGLTNAGYYETLIGVVHIRGGVKDEKKETRTL